MATVEATAREPAPINEVGRDFTQEQIRRWCSACDTFVLWERDHLIKGNPSTREKEEHKSSLKLLLRFTRLFHAAAADPDFPDRSITDMLAMALWKLEQSWRMIYEPLPEAQADKLLAEVFPE
jgi:hypothetical protein